MNPDPNWQRPRIKARGRTVDKFAGAVEGLEREERRLRRAFTRWDKARRKVARLNKRIDREES